MQGALEMPGEIEDLRSRLREIQVEAQNGKRIVESARDRNRSWNIAVLILGVLSGAIAGAFAVVAGVSNDSWPGVVAGIAGAVAGTATGAQAGFKFAPKTTHNEVKGADFGHVAGQAKNALVSNKSAEELERIVDTLNDRIAEIGARPTP